MAYRRAMNPANRAAKLAAFAAANPGFQEALRAATSKKYPNPFLVDIEYRLEQYGSLSEKQVEAVNASLAKAAVRAAERAAEQAVKAAGSEYVGVVGGRIELEVVVEKKIVLQNHWGTSFLNIASDAAGNAVVYLGGAEFPAEGQKALIRATVKAHSLYSGAKQTRIERPVILAVNIEQDLVAAGPVAAEAAEVAPMALMAA